MINNFTKLLSRNLYSNKFNNLFQLTKYQFSNVLIYHRLQIDSLSDKWHTDFSYTSAQLALNGQDKIKPNNFGKVFIIKLVQRSMRFTKGRPEYRIQFQTNQIIKLAYWSPKYGKFEIIRSGPYKQQVVTIQKVEKNKPDAVILQFLGSITNEKYPITLYRFNFYNNKLQGQKSKQFYLSQNDFNLFQQCLRSGFEGLTFHESKQQYEIWRLQRQIIKKEMIINKEVDQ